MNVPRTRADQLRFLGLSAVDTKNLAALAEPLQRHMEAVLDGFYDHLLEFPNTRALLSEPERLARLRESQRGYLESLTRGALDQDYLDRRLAIGAAHERMGVEPQWYLGAYARLFELLRPVVQEAAGPEPERARQLESSLLRLLNLDVQLVVEAYISNKEASLERANRELAAALERLQSAQDLLIRKEKLATLGQLAASVGHELRNPLGVIQNSVYYLRHHRDDPEAKVSRHLEILERELQRANKIIADLLDYARLRPGARRAVDLSLLVEDHLRERSGPAAVRLLLDLDRPGPIVQADPDQLRQVLENLLQNAIQSQPDGGEVLVESRRQDGGARLAVADRGPGIPPPDLERIFEPLYSTRRGGTGLGLALSRALVEANGGRIRADNRSGGGAVLVLDFPLGES